MGMTSIPARFTRPGDLVARKREHDLICTLRVCQAGFAESEQRLLAEREPLAASARSRSCPSRQDISNLDLAPL